MPQRSLICGADTRSRENEYDGVIPKPERRARRKRSKSKDTEEKLRYYAADAEEYDMPRSNRSKKSSKHR